jgi:two-component system CheB/CheR fusion protein
MNHDDATPPQSNPSHVVGVGASAGGLEALERLFRAMPADTGMAFVVIQHLSPDFKSLMSELLKRFTTMQAIPVMDSECIQANTIYLLPPRKDLIIENNVLISHDREKDGTLSMPINLFFRSLAASWGEQAIAVVLSGTGTDGSNGILDVRDAGGLVLVETPDSARFDGMPQSAIKTGCVDVILAPENMPQAMLAFATDPNSRHHLHLDDAHDDVQTGLPSILQLLNRHYKIDFNDYKPATIMRRISRRMAAMESGGVNIEQYSERLAQDPEELDTLYKDLLIGVTRFFRDPETFQVLSDSIVPQLIAETPVGEEVRIWVCGASTGEEAYSIAILFLDAFAKLNREPRVKVLATDLHEDSLTAAAEGIYCEDKFADMPKTLLATYFERQGDRHYKVVPSLRRCLIFSVQNVLKDPPFTRIHMVSCRNLLIYFQPPAQFRAIAALYYSLRIGGVMVLGTSETPGELAHDMELVDRHAKIYRKIKAGKTLLHLRSPPLMPEPIHQRTPLMGQMPRVYDCLLDKYIPDGILINNRREILHIFGATAHFIQAGSGRFSGDILNLVAHPISLALASALRSAEKHAREIRLRGIRHEEPNQSEQRLSIRVDPIFDRPTNECFFMIHIEPEYLIQTQEVLLAKESNVVQLDDEAVHHVRELEHELEKMRETLQTTVEELETTNEELQASNEELLASNEELQSTNEELHSVNEELYSVNAEHELKIEELNRITTDLRNLMQSTDTATIFVDNENRIRLYTPRALEIFNLMPQDIGRELSHFQPLIPDSTLFNDVKRVLTDQKAIVQQINCPDEKSFIRRCTIYQNMDGKQQGVVINYLDISEVSAAYDALYNAKMRLKAFMDHSPAIVWIKDEAGHYRYLNKSYRTHFGIEDTAWQGKTDADLWPAPLAQKFQVDDQAILASSHTSETEEQVPETNGRYSWWRLVKFVIRDVTGQRFIGGIGLNVTSQKQAEQALRLSESRYRQVTESLPQLVWTCTADGSCDYVGPQWIHYTGHADKQQLGDRWLEQVHPDDYQRTRDQWYTAVQQGTHFEIEYRIRRYDGCYRWFHALSVPVRDAQGQIIKWFGTSTDIDENRQAQLALQAREQLLQLFISRAPAALAMFDRNFCYLAVSQRWLDDYGLTDREQILGRSHYDLFPEIGEEWKQVYQRAFAGATIKNDEDCFRRANGQEQWLRWEVLPWYSSDDQIGGILIFAEEITAAVQARKKMEQLTVELEQRVTARTAELEQEKRALQASKEALAEAKLKAEAANQAKSTFLATMSHEIRTPLNAIVGTSYMLRRSHLDAEQQVLLATIESASHHLLAQINDILDLAKIEAGEINLEQVPFDLASLFASIASLFKPAVEAKGLQLILPDLLSIAVPPLVGDSHKLQQLLTNLLSNAVKFTLHGTIQVDLMVVERTETMITLCFTVSDTGIGITPEIMPQLFQPFVQGNSSTTRLYGGTGLGLSLVQRIVNCMGGSVDVESVPGQGSQFRLQVPFTIATTELSVIEQPNTKRDLTILIVDDDANDRQILTTLATELHWHAEALADGELLLAWALEHQERLLTFDCILIDWQMPNYNGLMILEQLHQRVNPLTLPAIIMISVADRNTVLQAITQAAIRPDDLLIKPVDVTQLLNTVNQAIAKHGQQQQCLTIAHIVSNEHYYLKGIRVLVVDDSPTNLEVCERILKYEGAHPTLCQSGAEAIQAVTAEPTAFDLILMDIRMPDMDGYETSRRLYSIIGERPLPIIALTAATLTNKKTAAAEAGMADFLTKPIDPVQLIHAIRQHVEQVRGQPVPLIARRCEQALSKTLQKTTHWPEIPGLALSAVQIRLADDYDFFISLLTRFLEETPSLLAEVRQAVITAQFETAAILSHRLRGQATTIGATTLAALLTEFETQADAKQLSLTQFDHGVEQIEAICKQLNDWCYTNLFNQVAVTDFAETAEIELDLEILAAFKVQLSAHDMSALTTFTQLTPALMHHLSESQFAALKQSMVTLEFKGACRLLDDVNLSTISDHSGSDSVERPA